MEKDTEMLSILDVLSPDSLYFNDLGKPLYIDNNYYKKSNFDFWSKVNNGKKNGIKCIIPNCNNYPIKKSHTIPEGTVLKKISDSSGHILYPKYVSEKKTYTMTPIGIGNASTFSGFCREHERIFEGFERTGDLHDKSILLQNFRVVCRDLFFFENQKNN